MILPIYQADAFTSHLFGGNPAAVCPLEHWPEDRLMQSIAAENNLAETAFFAPEAEGFRLRWFTPAMEVDLCGHATLASAFILFEKLAYAGNTIHFETRSGRLSVTRKEGKLEMDFPAAIPLTVKQPPAGLAESLGVSPREILRALDNYMVVVDTEKEVRAAAPDFEKIFKLDLFGVILTSRGDQVDFVSRYFAPRAGIDEDPATGSAHTILTPYWAKILGKNRLIAQQISSRVGELECSLAGDRVQITGECRFYMEGRIYVPES